MTSDTKQPDDRATEYELDADTALEPIGDGRYIGDLAERWSVGVGMNGGYLAAFCLRAVLYKSALPEPLSMTVHYLSRPVRGAAEVSVVPMRVGRGHATYRFDLVQPSSADEGGSAGDDLRATGLVMTGRLRDPGPFDFAPAAPRVRRPEQSSVARRYNAENESMAIRARLDQRVSSADDLFFMRSGPGEARTGGWTRLADGRPTDALCVPLFLDCWPPAVFSRTMRPDETGVPTLELTVHWRNRIEPGWQYASFRTDALAGGYVDEKGELWGENGVLVAESRQLARYGRSGPSQSAL